MQGKHLPGELWDLWLLYRAVFPDKYGEVVRMTFPLLVPYSDITTLPAAFYDTSAPFFDSRNGANVDLTKDRQCGGCSYTIQKNYCSDICLPPIPPKAPVDRPPPQPKSDCPQPANPCLRLRADRFAFYSACAPWPITTACNECVIREAKHNSVARNCLRCHEYWSSPFVSGYAFNPYALNVTDIVNQDVYIGNDDFLWGSARYQNMTDPSKPYMSDTFLKCKIAAISYSGSIQIDDRKCQLHIRDPATVT
ncbi:uncharacterized protein EV422DRAFT_566378 [Fimicolochytrium jonesii]|uniref:uncharacterized protein n=1 Tax=Fimicolochytrium jonesii TaxID=1396493 RepID=UPI0022FDC660|nr:uncharacterized protein EV422DRAFT_566378 [Fimicolochytrium jonesii]KAI8822712.1 hypothetical protein EV422DRAFT_566378 [Fimicolochytrium jonesii]